LLAESKQKEIDALRAALRRGHRSDVRAKLTTLQRNKPLWAQLTPDIQASALRLQAGLELDSKGNVAEADSLVAEAARLDPKANVVALQTRIRLVQDGAEAALRALGRGDDVETLCARGSLLIILGREDEAVEPLEYSTSIAPSRPRRTISSRPESSRGWRLPANLTIWCNNGTMRREVRIDENAR
jgi:tetratricopeptide (TPR) repeat protein